MSSNPNPSKAANKLTAKTTGKSSAKTAKKSPAKSAARSAAGSAPSTNLREEVVAYRRDRILQAACDAFYEHGYHECTVDMIAERLSGSKAIVYYYFSDKHSILYEIYQRALAEAQGLIEKAAANTDNPHDKLAAIARAYANWVIDNTRTVGVYWREMQSLSEDARASVLVEQKHIDDIVARVIRDGVSSGSFTVDDVQTTARAITGMITFTYTWWRADTRLSREGTVESYAQMSLRLAGAKQ